ncbi:hypothetical protein J5U18_11225 [Sphingobacteriaceae bacterium WQ 2009]|uniref:Uncharacterized protein n=1 Tax=Rhinopithecimicrobium faecis TaxID=2820698 RepID=A0A8T4HCU7_9SPHI|nr:hypothetical protein [Sphingobacteriaceae bacterium WQ 2009]
MSNFVTIKFVKAYREVVYYSVVVNGGEEDESLFEAFIQKYGITEKGKLNHILSWIREIGQIHGAQSYLFRAENDAEALPPLGVNRDPCYIENDKEISNPLRLYCHILNEHVVVLFGGGVKTAKTVQECANVRMPFYLANKLSKLIDKSIQKGEIDWDDDCRDILYEKEYILFY